MSVSSPHPNIVLLFSGHDPSGGAGIQADIESVLANQASCCSMITCSTVQDSNSVITIKPIDSEFFLQQLTLLNSDTQFNAIKIGLIGCIEILNIIINFIKKHPLIPVILDPVLKSGDGTPLANEQLTQAIFDDLLPLVTLATPNQNEAKLLSDKNTLEDAAKAILSTGCKNILITGADNAVDNQVSHTLFNQDNHQHFNYKLLPHHYHGSGCTLASTCAALIAQDTKLSTAVQQGLDYTYRTLETALTIGKGQKTPNRLLK